MRNDNFAEVLPCAEFSVGGFGVFEGHLVVDDWLNAVRSHEAIHCSEILSMTHGDTIERDPLAQNVGNHELSLIT